ncbi:PD-(D/E)XK nuclease family protein [Patescibacteria group bacterium]|nr:PD-(D/E)XK nuclease family protein [Patescibacteria group bacterium]MBU4353387.1 PD-(D/E)XK nuclease family protein [Patescibacteria group bacterium]MBU4477277.1 PD-(D/E)XK nuclease family protein [Patescibacteria group bacterium]MCG2699210.1 PD-(D/E)XK nuclease family protein [Candidatus Parcubacteria bacterium]
MRVSYSALDTYRTCPLKYKFQEIDRIKIPKNADMVFGSSIHSALKYMFERSPLYPTLDQVIDFFRGVWDASKLSVDMPSEQEEILYKEGISILEKFYKRNQPWNFNVVDLESRFGVDIENPETGEGHILSGIIDRVDKDSDGDFYEIIDYKTARKMPSQQIVDNDLQLSIYHLALAKRWPQMDSKKIKLSLYFVKHGEKISTSRNEEQLENTKKFVLKSIDEINERIKENYNFPPTPCPLCDWCGYKKMCPMFKHLYAKEYEKNKIKNQDELNSAIKEYFELKDKNQSNNERLDELKTVIYGFMDENKVERVFGGDGYLTRKIQERYSYDLEKIREVLEPIGKWEEILSADEKKLGKIIDSLPGDMQKKILALRAIKKIAVLTASKKKAGAETEDDSSE